MERLNKLTKTPLLLGAIALSPALFVTTSVELAFVYGIIFIICLVLTTLLSALIEKFVDSRYTFIVYAIVVLFEITIIELLLSTFLPLLIQNAGLYISLMAVQLIFIRHVRAEKIEVNQVVKFGLLFLAGLVLTGFVREFLSTFNIAYGQILPISAGQVFGHGNSTYGLVLLKQPAGGLIIIGLLLGILSQFVKEEEAHV